MLPQFPQGRNVNTLKVSAGAPPAPAGAAQGTRGCPRPVWCPSERHGSSLLPGTHVPSPAAHGSLLTWMFSSTFFHWQNRVNLSLQRSTERARVRDPCGDPPETCCGAVGPLGVVWRQVGPPPGDTDLRPDLEVTSPESLPWGPTPLELLTKKGALTRPKAGKPSSPLGWDTLAAEGLCTRLTSR